MKIVLVSSFLNHHQKPLCEAFHRACDEFHFVATESSHNVGYQVADEAEYVLHYFEHDQRELIRRKVMSADVVIFGSCPTELIEFRMSQNKLSFVYAERFFKKGSWRRFIPSTRKAINKKIINFKDQMLYVLAASAFLSEDLALMGFPPNKCFRWGYFPEIEKHENIQDILDIKEQRSILWCGRMIKLKHPEHVVRMAKKLKDNGYNFSLNIIGDGPLKKKIEDLVFKLGLSDRVHILGSKSHDEVRAYMQKSQIFVFNSNRMEGWGAVVNEAMNGGCCVVASHAVGSVPFLVKSGVTGEVYKSGNVNELYQTVSDMLEDKEKTDAIGENAYSLMINEWNAEVAAERLILLAKSLLDGENIISFDSGPCSYAPIIKDNWYKAKRSYQRMLRLSIVIPIYNLEKYISVTLDSCLRQNIPSDEYEIICINDGSADRSAEIISEYAEKHSNIRLHTQDNAGVSAARNKGIDLARGKYIWFVDGDDIIADNCLQGILKVVEENDVDILGIGMQSVSERVPFSAEDEKYRICPKDEEKLSFMTSKGGVGGGVWSQIFKAEILNNGLCFSKGIKYSEDVLFSFKALIKAERCAKTESVFYHYYQREGSAMHSSNHIRHIESMYLLATEYQNIADDEPNWKDVCLSKKSFAIKALLFSLVQNGDTRLAKEWIIKLRQEKLYPFPFLWGSLRNNVTRKQAIINYSSFLFPWKWYFMTCVRLVALKNKLKRKSK